MSDRASSRRVKADVPAGDGPSSRNATRARGRLRLEPVGDDLQRLERIVVGGAPPGRWHSAGRCPHWSSSPCPCSARRGNAARRTARMRRRAARAARRDRSAPSRRQCRRAAARQQVAQVRLLNVHQHEEGDAQRDHADLGAVNRRADEREDHERQHEQPTEAGRAAAPCAVSMNRPLSRKISYGVHGSSGAFQVGLLNELPHRTAASGRSRS